MGSLETLFGRWRPVTREWMDMGAVRSRTALIRQIAHDRLPAAMAAQALYQQLITDRMKRPLSALGRRHVEAWMAARADAYQEVASLQTTLGLATLEGWTYG